jgi:hypothetical protein
MRRKTLVLVAAMTAVAGCTLSRTEQRRGIDEGIGSLLSRAGGGRVIEPKRSLLRVVILSRPLRDPVVDQAVWSGADEQAVAPVVRRALHANGLRVGLISGGLPSAVEAAVHAPPPDKVSPMEFNLPDGADALVSLAERTPQASLLLNRGDRAFGKDYEDASGWLRVTANHDGPTGVALRFDPEIHHGPVLQRFDALPNNAGGSLNAMQFRLKDGQLEETFRDLAASFTLQPGQAAAIGCDPDRRGSVGTFLFTQPEPNSDRLTQKVVLLWAVRSDLGEPGSQPTPSSRLLPVEPPDLPGLDQRGKEKDPNKAGATPMGS